MHAHPNLLIAANNRGILQQHSQRPRVVVIGANNSRSEAVVNEFVGHPQIERVYALTDQPLESTDRKLVGILHADFQSGDSTLANEVPMLALALVSDEPAEESESAFINRLKARTQNYTACRADQLKTFAVQAYNRGARHLLIVTAQPFHASSSSLAAMLSQNERDVMDHAWQTIDVIRTVAPYRYKANAGFWKSIANVWLRQLEFMIPEKQSALTTKEICAVVTDIALEALAHGAAQTAEEAKQPWLRVFTPLEVRERLEAQAGKRSVRAVRAPN
jgi:hypothetical protein